MPCIPATKTKSPALAPRLHVPSVLMAPGGLSVLTPFGDGDCAKPRLETMAIAVAQGRTSSCNISALPIPAPSPTQFAAGSLPTSSSRYRARGRCQGHRARGCLANRSLGVFPALVHEADEAS